MELPRVVVVGREILENTGEILNDLETGRNCLVISGPNVRQIVETRLGASLKNSGFDFRWEVGGASTFAEVERIAQLAREERSDFLIGVGGGRSIDIAKLASFKIGRASC